MSSVPEMLREKYDLDHIPRIVAVRCLSTAPFAVAINGAPEPVPARRIAGQAFAVNDTGMALWQPPLPPICFKTI